MKIFKGSITDLASRGYLTIQVPDCIIDTRQPPSPDYEDVPDDWIVCLKDDVPVYSSKQSGFLMLTRKGWKANKDKIKAVFMALPANHRRGSWQDFENVATEHFSRVDKAIKNRRERIEKELKALDDYERK
jgi:hypothetical protein